MSCNGVRASNDQRRPTSHARDNTTHFLQDKLIEQDDCQLRRDMGRAREGGENCPFFSEIWEKNVFLSENFCFKNLANHFKMFVAVDAGNRSAEIDQVSRSHALST